MKKLEAALFCVLFMFASAGNAGVLLGNGTLNNANDLTRISDGSTTYEFLDLSTTVGQTIAGAVGTYGGQGFHLANSNELTSLYSAFGFNYVAPSAGGFAVLTVSGAEAALFTSYLGTTFDNAALASYNDLSVGVGYTCISQGTCYPTSFVFNTNVFDGDSVLGVYLVREQSTVPEPMTLGLTGLGLVGIAISRRRKDK